MSQTSASVSFPLHNAAPRAQVEEAVLRSWEFEHEMLIVTFRGATSQQIGVRTGDPVAATVKGANRLPMTFVGYVQRVVDKATQEPKTPRRVVVYCVGPTWPLKNGRTKVWRNLTISEIAAQILREKRLTADIEPHPVRLPMVNQVGESDWSFLVRLAKQYGYVLYPTGTVVHFHSRSRDENNSRALARGLTYRPREDPVPSGIWSFTPILDETGAGTEGGGKLTRIAAAADPRTGATISYRDTGVPSDPVRNSAPPAIFQVYDHSIQAGSFTEMQAKVEGSKERSRWYLQAEAELYGYPDMRPTSVLYLDGLGGGYNGYWTIIGIEHPLRPFDVPNHYLARVLLGTNSLGRPIVGSKPQGYSYLPGITPETKKISQQSVLVTPNNLNAVDLQSVRGGPTDFSWQGSVSSVNP